VCVSVCVYACACVCMCVCVCVCVYMRVCFTRFKVLHGNNIIVGAKFGVSFGHPPGSNVVDIDKYNIMLRHRRQGHGTALMRIFMEIFQRGGTQRFRVTSPTAAGRRFYKQAVGSPLPFSLSSSLTLKSSSSL
jgi:hypothetical protein